MKKIPEKIESVRKFFESRTAFTVLCTTGVLLVVVLIFSFGVTVGFHKASFGQAWEQNYEHNFGMRPNRPMFENFPNAHGATGKIIKTELPTVIVEDRDNTERVVLIKDDTQIQEARNNVNAADLKINDFVVVIGTPNEQGQVEAKFIRILPNPKF